MTGGFDTNVPERKPRTRIARVLSELSSDVAERPTEAPEEAPPARETSNGTATVTRSGTGARHDSGVPEAGGARERTRLDAARDRVTSLRERLAQASHPPVAATEPGRAAAAVLEVVQDLRARLDAAMQERTDMAKALDDTRAELARARADVDKERRMRAAVEAQAEERAHIAADAVGEAEALAAERDQVLSELAKQRRLDDEQAELVAEVETMLKRRDEERAAASREIAELRDVAEARAVQLEEMEIRAQAGAEDYARLEARCHELEAQVAELTEVQRALEALQATVHRRKP